MFTKIQKEGDKSAQTPKQETNEFDALNTFLGYSRDSAHLKTGPREYVTLTRSGNSFITLHRMFSKGGEHLSSKSFFFKRGVEGPLAGSSAQLGNLVKRIETSERAWSAVEDIQSIPERNRYRFEHPECFTLKEFDSGVMSFVRAARSVKVAIYGLSRHSELVRPGFAAIAENTITAFMDALYCAWELNTQLKTDSLKEEKSLSSLSHYKFDVGSTWHTWGPLHSAVESALQCLDILQMEGSHEKGLQSLRSAAHAIKAGCDRMLAETPRRYTYYFRNLHEEGSNSDPEDSLQAGDIITLKDGRRIILFTCPEVRDHGWHSTIFASGMVLQTDGIVSYEEQIDLSHEGSCDVTRSERQWAFKDAPGLRAWAVREGKQPARLEKLGSGLDGKPVYIAWSGKHPFAPEHVPWIQEQIENERITHYPVVESNDFIEALGQAGFPKELLPPKASKTRKGVPMDVPPPLEAGQYLPGLETFTRLLQENPKSVYLHIVGSPLPDENFVQSSLAPSVITSSLCEEQLAAVLGRGEFSSPSEPLSKEFLELLARYPVTPVLLLAGNSKTYEHDIALARRYGWKFLVLKSDSGEAARHLDELEPLAERGHVSLGTIKRSQKSFVKAIDAILSTAPDTSVTSIPFVPKGSTVTNTWMRHFDSEVSAFERECCEAVHDTALASEEEFQRCARLLRTIHTAFRTIRRELLFHDLTLADWPEQCDLLSGIERSLESPAPDIVVKRLETIKDALSEIAVFKDSREVVEPTADELVFEESISQRDLARMSEIMESGRNDIFGASGSLHGMMYGDMSPARFADFIDKGAQLVTYRDKLHKKIQGFILFFPKEATLAEKPETASAFSETETARAIAISIDLHYKEREPELYAKLIRSFLLHQMRDGVGLVHMRVHPRNLKASVPHMATAGFLPTSVADEWVDGQRFVTMFHDLVGHCERPGTYSPLQLSKAVAVAWALYMEEFPGRSEESKLSATYAEDLKHLITARLRAWTNIESALHSCEDVREQLASVKSALSSRDLQIKLERQHEIEEQLDQIANAGEVTPEHRAQLESALFLALTPPKSLRRDLEMLRLYIGE